MSTGELFEAGVIESYAKDAYTRYFGTATHEWEKVDSEMKQHWINTVRPIVTTMRARERMVEELASIVGLADGETYLDIPAKVRALKGAS